jgi:membrane protease YdiL (CAAX protease family)
MFLGILLGYLYFFSGNIWIAIWGHFVFNGVQVLSKFLNVQSEEVLPDNLVPNPDVIWVIISALLTTGVFFYFNKLKAK